MAKILILMRHGEEDSKTDKLTKEGTDQIKAAVKHLKTKGYFPELIMHSPVDRAVESAEIAIATFKAAGHEIGQTLQKERRLALDEIDLVIPELSPSLSVILMMTHGPDIKNVMKKLRPNYDIFQVRNGHTIVIMGEKGHDWRDILTSQHNKIMVDYIPG